MLSTAGGAPVVRLPWPPQAGRSARAARRRLPRSGWRWRASAWWDAERRDLCLDAGTSRCSFYRVKKGLVETKRVVAIERGRRSVYLPAEQAFGATGTKWAQQC